MYALREYDLQRAHITFDVQFGDTPLPPARIDLPALSMILLNLVLNAEQALAATADGRIELTAAAAGGRLFASVRDNGPGVAGEVRERIFDPFFTTGAPGATMGLGLRAARHLAEQHGATLVLADTPAQDGACFDLNLPTLT